MSRRGSLLIGDRVKVVARSAWKGRTGVVERFDEEARTNPLVIRFDSEDAYRRGTTMHFAWRELRKLPAKNTQRGSVEGGALVQFVALLSAFTAGLAAILNDRALWGPALVVLIVACLAAFAWGRRRGARAAAFALAYAMKKLGNGVRVRDAMKFLTRPEPKNPRGEVDFALVMILLGILLMVIAVAGEALGSSSYPSRADCPPSSCSGADGGSR